jgi:hypothetical protein
MRQDHSGLKGQEGEKEEEDEKDFRKAINLIYTQKGGIPMAIARTVTYECETCGTELVVTESGGGYLSPIYCCGAEVKEVAIPAKKAAPRKKAKKKSPAKKRPAKKRTKK